MLDMPLATKADFSFFISQFRILCSFHLGKGLYFLAHSSIFSFPRIKLDY